MADHPDTPLSWTKQDIEQRLLFPGARFTRANTLLGILLALALSVLFYAVLIAFSGRLVASMFTEQGSIPYFIVFFTAWSLTILVIKRLKVGFQRKALNKIVVPRESGFVLSAGNADDVITRIYEIVDDPKHFVLFNRIAVALANLKNLGRVGDVDEILRTQADNDDDAMENSYVLVAGFVWAIPVLGFIGTVLGLSQAIGEFGSVLQASDDISQIKEALTGVTGGLSKAFVTTLQALVAALGIQLLLTFVRKNELEFMEECSTYCTRHIVNRLRIMPFEKTLVDD